MNQITFDLTANGNKTDRTNPGNYKVTVTGLSDPDAVVYVRPRNEADTDWDAGVTINATESGLIGVKAVTINSNGLVNCHVTGLNDPSRVKVRISK